MKKILIAILFACIMLILPLNNVVGVSDVEDDCNCKPVNNLHLVILERLSNRLDRLLDRVEVYIGIISILYRHKPDFTGEFKELSNAITSLRESNDALESVFEFGLIDEICEALGSIIVSLIDYTWYLDSLMEEYPALIPILLPIRLTLDIVIIQLFLIFNLICDVSPYT
jgi:hypothetical protein